MNVKVIAFASARESIGAAELILEIPDGSDLETLRASLSREYPGLVEQWPRLAVAVDGVLVRGNRSLTSGQEIALLPPVSGGCE